TTSGMIACQVGMIIAMLIPTSSVKISSDHCPISPISVSTASIPATSKRPRFAASRYLRRSTMSDSAPDGSRMKKAGREVAVCIRATITGDADRVVINQLAPPSCLHAPTFDTSVASHNQRKVLLRRAAQGEGGEAMAVWLIGAL